MQLTLLMRLIDDFLLLTTSRTVAEEFVSVLHSEQARELGCVLNSAKTRINFIPGVELQVTPGTSYLNAPNSYAFYTI